MKIRQLFPFLRAYLASRYRHETFKPTCGDCPHWQFHSRVLRNLPRTRDVRGALQDAVTVAEPAGVCGLDVPKIFNDFDTGFALKAWTANDWCHRHPLYDERPIMGSDLEYLPGANKTKAQAGFSRVPLFAEALALAAKRQGITREEVAKFMMGPDDTVDVKGVIVGTVDALEKPNPDPNTKTTL